MTTGDDVLLRVEGVSKKFCRSLRRSLLYGVQDMASELVGGKREERRLRADEFWAVDEVSFELKRGECLGLIGHNGAGKTTLLRMLNGLIKPDKGRISLRGRVGALIALGAGFNPILTGRENIYVNAAILGLSKRETDAKFDEIVDFADVHDFIDAPLQSYSSGMAVRLGFAVATIVSPDVLLLDEVLAVGDFSFRHKCYSRVMKLLDRAAVIFVSHSMEYVGQLCNRVVLMEDGRARAFSAPADAIAEYLRLPGDTQRRDDGEDAIRVIYPPITHVDIRVSPAAVTYGSRLAVEVILESTARLPNVIFAFSANNPLEQTVLCWYSSRSGRQFDIQPGRQRLRFDIHPLYLHDGVYRWSFNVLAKGSIEHVVWYIDAGAFEVVSNFPTAAHIPYLPQAQSCQFDLLPPDPAMPDD